MVGNNHSVFLGLAQWILSLFTLILTFISSHQLTSVQHLWNAHVLCHPCAHSDPPLFREAPRKACWLHLRFEHDSDAWQRTRIGSCNAHLASVGCFSPCLLLPHSDPVWQAWLSPPFRWEMGGQKEIHRYVLDLPWNQHLTHCKAQAPGPTMHRAPRKHRDPEPP